MRLPGPIECVFDGTAFYPRGSLQIDAPNAGSQILTNILILVSIVLGHGLQLLFYGPLRTIEVEQLYEKAWYAVTETCLAMTIFRDEFDVRFIIMFGVLLFVKCFSWIGSGRVEFVRFRFSCMWSAADYSRWSNNPQSARSYFTSASRVVLYFCASRVRQWRCMPSRLRWSVGDQI